MDFHWLTLAKTLIFVRFVIPEPLQTVSVAELPHLCGGTEDAERVRRDHCQSTMTVSSFAVRQAFTSSA